MSFGDIQAAIRMRELITTIAEGVVNRMRPEDRIGRVYSYNRVNQTAQILFAGETIDSLVTAHCASNMIPSEAMISEFNELGYDAPGNIVRVSGPPGQYFISDYIEGGPLVVTSEGTVTPPGDVGPPHSNSHFDTAATSSATNGSGFAQGTRPIPTGWGFYWGAADVLFRADYEDTVNLEGHSLKLDFQVADRHQWIQSTVFNVVPGATIDFSYWAKGNNPVVNPHLMSRPDGTPDFFDGVSNNQATAYEEPANDGQWHKRTVNWTVPATHTRARFNLMVSSYASAGGGAGTIRLDATDAFINESGIITGTDVIATDELKGEILRVNERRFYEDPVLGRSYGSLTNLTNVPNDAILRTVYLKENITIPAGTRYAIIHMHGLGQCEANAACHWRGLVNLAGAGYVEYAYTLCHNNGRPATTMVFSHTMIVNIPVAYSGGATNLGIATNCSTDSGSGSWLYTNPGSYEVTFMG
jgi:hypothetical protein